MIDVIDDKGAIETVIADSVRSAIHNVEQKKKDLANFTALKSKIEQADTIIRIFFPQAQSIDARLTSARIVIQEFNCKHLMQCLEVLETFGFIERGDYKFSLTNIEYTVALDDFNGLLNYSIVLDTYKNEDECTKVLVEDAKMVKQEATYALVCDA